MQYPVFPFFSLILFYGSARSYPSSRVIYDGQGFKPLEGVLNGVISIALACFSGGEREHSLIFGVSAVEILNKNDHFIGDLGLIKHIVLSIKD